MAWRIEEETAALGLPPSLGDMASLTVDEAEAVRDREAELEARRYQRDDAELARLREPGSWKCTACDQVNHPNEERCQNYTRKGSAWVLPRQSSRDLGRVRSRARGAPALPSEGAYELG